MIPQALIEDTAFQLMATAAIEIPADYLAGIQAMARAEDGDLSAFVLQAMLEGESGPFRDIVLYSSAAALLVAGKADDLKSGVALAAEAVDSGAARRTLAQVVAISNEQVAS